MMRSTRQLAAAAGALFAATAAFWPRPADACGGFFCSQVPIDQAGEQIAFSVSPNHVTAYIQIAYTGKAEDFAWVVPVQVKPTISVGTASLFTTLAGQTRPQFQVEWPGQNQCLGFAYPEAAADGGGGRGGSPTGGVQVLEQKEVGPYETVTLSSGNAAELVKWLKDNGFDQPDSSTPLIEHYVKKQMLFVALKLKRDAEVGDIVPVVLDMDNPEPCVPLVLTQVAAVPNMPVLVYVFGAARAAPENWFEVEVNLEKIDWFNFGSNYGQVLNEAMNEAAGHGFATEFAGPTTPWKELLWKDGRYDTSKLLPLTAPKDLVQALLEQGYPRDSTMRSLLRKHVPMPATLAQRGVTEQQFYNQLASGQDFPELAGVMVNTAAFVAELDEKILKPLRDAQALVDAKPYATRLYTTVSPEEMTRDPLFLMNSELPNVSNVHKAKAYGMCSSQGVISNLKLELEDGRVIEYPSTNTIANTRPPVPMTNKTKASAHAIRLVPRVGKPILVKPEDVAELDRQLNVMTSDMVVELARTRAGQLPTSTTSTGGGGCSVAGEQGAAELAGVALLGFAVVFTIGRRRRG